jgi:hypothetical protein
MKYLVVVSMLIITGCGGGGNSTSSSAGGNLIDPGIRCPILTTLINGECVSILEDPPDSPPPDNSSVRPQLSAGEPVLLTVTLDWVPPAESWEGSPPPFLAGYEIFVSEWQSTIGVFQVFQQISLDNPGLVTYVLDLPGPGRWGITMSAVSITGSDGPQSNIEIIDIATP